MRLLELQNVASDLSVIAGSTLGMNLNDFYLVLASIIALYSSRLLAIVVFPLTMAWCGVASPLKSMMWGSELCISNIETHPTASHWVACGCGIKKEILNSRKSR